jgi:hypothetical protein
MKMDKERAEAWRKWWLSEHGKNMPMGGYHSQEGFLHDAFAAGWDAAVKQSQVEINHLKAQLMRANTNDGAYKAAYLAGQMTARGGSWE